MKSFASFLKESHPKSELMKLPTSELRKLGNTYSKKVSVVRDNAVKAKEAGNQEKAEKLHKQADAHQDEEMDIREIIRSRTKGTKK
jgi:hypothetical protein